jgi:hypothetical protein
LNSIYKKDAQCHESQVSRHASAQEAVRKDDERAFAAFVVRWHIPLSETLSPEQARRDGKCHEGMLSDEQYDSVVGPQQL